MSDEQLLERVAVRVRDAGARSVEEDTELPGACDAAALVVASGELVLDEGGDGRAAMVVGDV